jgi:hypothetical protein
MNTHPSSFLLDGHSQKKEKKIFLEWAGSVPMLSDRCKSNAKKKSSAP